MARRDEEFRVGDKRSPLFLPLSELTSLKKILKATTDIIQDREDEKQRKVQEKQQELHKIHLTRETVAGDSSNLTRPDPLKLWRSPSMISSRN